MCIYEHVYKSNNVKQCEYAKKQSVYVAMCMCVDKEHISIHTCITLHYFTLHYLTLHDSTLYCLTLHYNTLHFMNLIKYLHTYIPIAFHYITFH